MTKDIADSIR